MSWSTEIQPGNWIVFVTGTDVDENGGGVAVGLLEASVQEGASIDLVMQRGGLISLASEWTSIENNVLNAGDVDGGVMVEIDLGDDIAWNQAFDSSGMLDLVLPAGTVNLDSEFETIEHDLGCLLYTSPSPRDFG